MDEICPLLGEESYKCDACAGYRQVAQVYKKSPESWGDLCLNYIFRRKEAREKFLPRFIIKVRKVRQIS